VSTPLTSNNGLGHALFLTSNGAVYCSGANGNGQCGNGTTSAKINFPNFAQAFPPNITKIASGDWSTCVLSAGKVACYGQQYYGNFGTGNFADQITTIYMIGISNIVDISMSAENV